MGWEYHDRHRDRRGRFLRLGTDEQIHIRCTPEDHALIQARAYARRMDITAYIMDLVKHDFSRDYPQAGKVCVHTDETGERRWKS